jgi:uncharacterized ferritin-like protein (DUF455 family)
MRSVEAAIRAALLTPEPFDKAMATRLVRRAWRAGELALRCDTVMPDRPGRPERPELLPPAAMPKRGKAGSLRGRIALLHALAHVECVAIDLALDMAGRFGRAQERAFVDDWLGVAADEAMHFVLLARRLRALGSGYGALPAHGGLWEAAEATRGDIAARLAVVPMVLEARGLDVTPATIVRLRRAGDERSARILERILDDEIRHVRIGTKHFLAICERDGQDPVELWKTLVRSRFRGSLKPPFNDSARQAAGLSRSFYAALAT